MITHLEWQWGVTGEGRFTLRATDDGWRFEMRVSDVDIGRYVTLTEPQAVCIAQAVVAAEATEGLHQWTVGA